MGSRLCLLALTSFLWPRFFSIHVFCSLPVFPSGLLPRNLEASKLFLISHQDTSLLGCVWIRLPTSLQKYRAVEKRGCYSFIPSPSALPDLLAGRVSGDIRDFTLPVLKLQLSHPLLP